MGKRPDFRSNSCLSSKGYAHFKKKEEPCYGQFLLFPVMFSKAFFLRAVKNLLNWLSIEVIKTGGLCSNELSNA